MEKRIQKLFVILFFAYVLFTFGVTLLIREPSVKERIITQLILSHKSSTSSFFHRDIIINILLFMPIGVLAGILSEKCQLMHSLLTGLFISETIECSQLIWKLGTFDVNDLLNNTLGAFVGGLIVVIVVWIKRLKNK